MEFQVDRDRFEAAHLLHTCRGEQEKSHQSPARRRQLSFHSFLVLLQGNFRSRMEEFRSQVKVSNPTAEPSTFLHV